MTDVWPESEPFGDPRAKSLHETVGRLHQSEDQRHPVGMLEIHRHRPASAVHQVDVGILVGRIGGPLEPVDPHDVGAGVGQHHPGERGRSQPGQLDDADSVERPAHRAPADDRGGAEPDRRAQAWDFGEGHGRMVAAADPGGQIRTPRPAGRAVPPGYRAGHGSGSRSTPRSRGPRSTDRAGSGCSLLLGPQRIADRLRLERPRGADWCHRSDEPQDPVG